MASWRGQLTAAAIEKRGGIRARVWVMARFVIVDAGQIEFDTSMKLSYPATELAGLNAQEKFEKIRDETVGGTPSLRDIGGWLLQDWNDGAVIRQLPANYEFGP